MMTAPIECDRGDGHGARIGSEEVPQAGPNSQRPEAETRHPNNAFDKAGSQPSKRSRGAARRRRSISNALEDTHFSGKSQDDVPSKTKEVQKDKANEKPRKEERSRSRSRSRSREPHYVKGNRGKVDDDSIDDNASLTRRRKLQTLESPKLSPYVKSNSTQQREKQESWGRKSSVLGSLHAFLEEGKSASPRKQTESRSVVSSASKIRRARSHSLSSGSVAGRTSSARDDKASTRDEKRGGRRSWSGSITARRRGSMGTTTTVSDLSSTWSGGSSRDSDRSRFLGGDKSGRLQRRTSIASSYGAEVPPGFPIAAVESAAVSLEYDESENSSIAPSIAESTVLIRQRQQRRAVGTSADKRTSAIDPEVEDFRKARRRQTASTSTGKAAGIETSDRSDGPEGNPNFPLNQPVAIAQADPSQPLSRRSSTHTTNSEGSASAAPETRVGGEQKAQKGKKSLDSLDPPFRDNMSGSVAATPPARGCSEEPGGVESNDSADKERAEVRGDCVSKGRNASKTPPEKQSSKKKRRRTKADREAKRGVPKTRGSGKENKSDATKTSSGDGSNQWRRNRGVHQSKLGSSVGSLDPSLLKKPAPISRISSVEELYYNANDAQGAMELPKEAAEEQSLPGHSLEEGMTPRDFNQSLMSFDSSHLRCVAAALVGAGERQENGQSRAGSLGTTLGETLVACEATAELPQDEARVSWIELPVHNPEELVLKSADTDGSNERTEATTAEKVSCIDETNDCEYDLVGQPQDQYKTPRASTPASTSQAPDEETSSTVVTGRSNPSLDVALGQNGGKNLARSEDRTVATTTTSNTNNSETTVKTCNKSLTKNARQIQKEDMLSPALDARKLEPQREDDSADERSNHASSVMSEKKSRDVLVVKPTPEPEKNRKGRERKSSKTSNHKRSSKSRGSSKGKGRSRGPEGKECRKSGKSSERRQGRSKERKNTGCSTDKSQSKTSANSESSTRRHKAGTKIKYVTKNLNQGQTSGGATGEVNDDENASHQSVPTVDTDDSSKCRRKRSYLPRKSVKADHKKSNDHKTSINSSLDKLLKTLENSGPVIKDENRSVYSEVRKKDNEKRIRNKRKTGLTDQLESDRGDHSSRENDEAEDSISVASEPMLSSEQSRKLHEKGSRPVVDLKATNFSKKLHKLRVAF